MNNPETPLKFEQTINIFLYGLKEAGAVDMNKISDGYHTFGELYDHRCVLYLVLVKALIENGTLDKFDSYKSWKHNDESTYEGWFITGFLTPRGWISYHLPSRMWDACKLPEREVAPPWDGHTAEDVLNRLISML